MSSSRSSESRWRWPVFLSLAATVPAFYLELLHEAPGWVPDALYGVAALVLAASRRTTPEPEASQRWLGARRLDLALIAGLMVAALLPPSSLSTAALTFRLLLALPILVRMMLTLRHLVHRRGLGYLLSLAAVVVGLCGVGFWWLEPNALTLADGLWLAFTTAATVGYGDIVPSTPASKIFSLFVVLLGYGVLSLVTAGIAAVLVESQERKIERDILHAMHADLKKLRDEVARLRKALPQVPEEDTLPPGA